MLNLVQLGIPGEFFTVVGGLGAQEILLDAERNFFKADQDDDEDWMWIAVLS